ncbi:hypothetical protein FRC17_007929, partial [Serendipita sp. 399]
PLEFKHPYRAKSRDTINRERFTYVNVFILITPRFWPDVVWIPFRCNLLGTGENRGLDGLRNYSELPIGRAKSLVPELRRQAAIPTLVAYQHGSVQACGEEAVEAFEDDKTTVAHYFKLRLHPEHMKRSLSRQIPSLPPGVTLEQAYCDIMSYMFQHTRKFFESQTGYSAVWRRLRSSIEIILAIPNGWDVREQTSLRRAAINARIVGSWNADTQLKFIPEAEASVHFALHHGTIKSWLTRGCNFVVVDAGGSTVDSTLYVCKSIKAPIHLEEVCSSKCVQAGGIFVDEQAEIMLKRKFRKSRFNHQAYLSAMVRDFEKKVGCSMMV